MWRKTMPVPPPSGASFIIASDPSSSKSSGQVVQLADGRIAVAWTNFGTMEIGFRLMNADGSVATGELDVSSALDGQNEGVRIAALAGGGFVVVWTN
jgi:large repetitive protein